MRNSDKIFIIPIILLVGNFIYRLINFAKIITIFPLDKVNDISSYITLVYFFKEYGFLGFVPDWYNGFILFNTYPPGWVVYDYLFYITIGNLLLATFISTLCLYLLGFIGIWLIGKEIKISKIKIIAFFLFVFANPMLIGAVLKQGRLPSLMALVLFVYLVYICLYFKDQEINWRIIFLSLIYAAIILTHQPEAILGGIFILGLIFLKKNKERIYVIGATTLGVILSLFWVIPFIHYVRAYHFLDLGFSNWILDFEGYFWNNLIGIIISLGVLVFFLIYYKQRNKTQDLIFFSPVLILALLYLSRLISFIPLIKNIYIDPYNDFFLFFLTLFLVSLDYKNINKKIKGGIIIGLIIFSILGVLYNLTQTPYMEDRTDLEQNFLNLIPQIEGKYIFMFSEPLDTYSSAYYGYSTIYYDKYTVSGWGIIYKEYEYTLELEGNITQYFKERDCDPLLSTLKDFNTTEILTYGIDCEALTNDCKLPVVNTSGDACLLKIE
ncbi:MAG: 6-pyruvoyl-tetrahydropterin synthase-related protein [bacterium]|nr:6-pyruvoyl-tetrahydropterin synthase-related protein [bacterium]